MPVTEKDFSVAYQSAHDFTVQTSPEMPGNFSMKERNEKGAAGVWRELWSYMEAMEVRRVLWVCGGRCGGIQALWKWGGLCGGIRCYGSDEGAVEVMRVLWVCGGSCRCIRALWKG